MWMNTLGLNWLKNRCSDIDDKLASQAWRTGLDLGMTLIDTAEMSAAGGAEQLVGDAKLGAGV